MSDRLPALSVFFPVFNEIDHLEKILRDILEFLPHVAEDFEVIIIDDGSSDGTAGKADELAARWEPVRCVHHKRNQGYGAAVATGFKACRMQAVFFTDGDGQFDIRDLKRFVPLLAQYDMVLGYREHRADPLIRRIYSRLWTGLIRLLFGVRVRDLNCAFKLFRGEAAARFDLRSTANMINAELLSQAVRFGFSYTELPVAHLPRTAGEESGGHPWVIVRTFWELFKYVLRYRKIR